MLCSADINVIQLIWNQLTYANHDHDSRISYFILHILSTQSFPCYAHWLRVNSVGTLYTQHYKHIPQPALYTIPYLILYIIKYIASYFIPHRIPQTNNVSHVISHRNSYHPHLHYFPTPLSKPQHATTPLPNTHI